MKETRSVQRRISALVLAIMVMSTFLFTLIQAKHHCTGSECSYCTCIRQCRQSLELPLFLIATVVVIVDLLPIRKKITPPFVKGDQQRTLIGLKIRMNN